jgi:hypothetical protein
MEWIYTKDDLPKTEPSVCGQDFSYSDDVLVTDGYDYKIGYFAIKHGRCEWGIYNNGDGDEYFEVIAWMPIPKFKKRKD